MTKQSQIIMELVDKHALCYKRLSKLIAKAMKLTGNVSKFSEPINDAIAIRAKLQAIADSLDWISVEDRLPNNIGSYMCFWENCYIGMLFFNSNKEWCEMWQQEKHKPTHWKPLPEPPKDK